MGKQDQPLLLRKRQFVFHMFRWKLQISFIPCIGLISTKHSSRTFTVKGLRMY